MRLYACTGWSEFAHLFKGTCFKVYFKIAKDQVDLRSEQSDAGFSSVYNNNSTVPTSPDKAAWMYKLARAFTEPNLHDIGHTFVFSFVFPLFIRNMRNSIF